MNKAELIANIAAQAGLTKKDSAKALDAMVEIVSSSLKKGDKVSIPGFGTFEVRDRAAREGVNPATGAKISIPATKAPAFKAGKALKDTVNN